MIFQWSKKLQRPSMISSCQGEHWQHLWSRKMLSQGSLAMSVSHSFCQQSAPPPLLVAKPPRNKLPQVPLWKAVPQTPLSLWVNSPSFEQRKE